MADTGQGIPPSRGPQTKNEWGVLVILSFFFVFFLCLELARDFSPAKLSVPFFLGSYVILLVIHELGHAIMAKLVGWKVLLISIGSGKVRLRIEAFGIPIEFRTVPLSGFVLPKPADLVAPRWKQFLITAAGPGIELFLVGIAVSVFGTEKLLQQVPDVSLIAVQSFCVAAIIGAGFNLIPFTHRTEQGRGWSDGLGMILCWRISDEAFQRRMEDE